MRIIGQEKPKPLSPPNCKECRYCPYNKSINERLYDGFDAVLTGFFIVLIVLFAAMFCVHAGKGLWNFLVG